MIELLASGAVWLLLSIPFAVLVGKCIGAGQVGETARHAAAAAQPKTTAAPLQPDTVSAEDESATPAPGSAAFPAQRQPAVPATIVD